MKIYFVEKTLISVALLSVSTAVLSSLSPTATLLPTTSSKTQATTFGRALTEPHRVSSAYQSIDRRGRKVVVDPQGGMVVKGTMAGAMADSYQGAQYVTQRDLEVEIKPIK